MISAPPINNYTPDPNANIPIITPFQTRNAVLLEEERSKENQLKIKIKVFIILEFILNLIILILITYKTKFGLVILPNTILSFVHLLGYFTFSFNDFLYKIGVYLMCL